MMPTVAVQRTIGLLEALELRQLAGGGSRRGAPCWHRSTLPCMACCLLGMSLYSIQMNSVAAGLHLKKVEGVYLSRSDGIVAARAACRPPHCHLLLLPGQQAMPASAAPTMQTKPVSSANLELVSMSAASHSSWCTSEWMGACDRNEGHSTSIRLSGVRMASCSAWEQALAGFQA